MNGEGDNGGYWFDDSSREGICGRYRGMIRGRECGLREGRQ